MRPRTGRRRNPGAHWWAATLLPIVPCPPDRRYTTRHYTGFLTQAIRAPVTLNNPGGGPMAKRSQPRNKDGTYRKRAHAGAHRRRNPAPVVVAVAAKGAVGKAALARAAVAAPKLAALLGRGAVRVIR
jgi:hypothetical protein